MTTIKKGMVVCHKRWPARHKGTVVNVTDDGQWIFVQWHNTVVEDQLRPDEVEVIS